ncbi:MAG: hypothetical protein M1834_003797 [Cirrosporium novae-zelandiae]|nr:MAG: hypothetical protein M1834_003797 [Cirrosporium novae-zelandiae]
MEPNQDIHVNLSEETWRTNYSIDQAIAQFHDQLPSHAPTPLKSLPSLARHLGLGYILLKEESHRCGLNAYKILGASWGTYRALAAKLGKPLTISLEEMGVEARKAEIILVTATDGNHGRAIARMGKLLGLETRIIVPRFLDEAAKTRIASEGPHVTVVVADGDYDEAVRWAVKEKSATKNPILVQDVAWEGYEDIPRWIVDGYSTLFAEIDLQMPSIIGDKKLDLVISPVGAGALCQAVVQHYKRVNCFVPIVTVEPVTAGCLHQSLKTDKATSIETSDSIMSGLNCGTVSSIAWPLLRLGVDVSVVVSELEAHISTQNLLGLGINAGPCGAAPLAALEKICRGRGIPGLKLDKNNVALLICTEGDREYRIPE